MHAKVSLAMYILTKKFLLKIMVLWVPPHISLLLSLLTERVGL